MTTTTRPPDPTRAAFPRPNRIGEKRRAAKKRISAASGFNGADANKPKKKRGKRNHNQEELSAIGTRGDTEKSRRQLTKEERAVLVAQRAAKRARSLIKS